MSMTPRASRGEERKYGNLPPQPPSSAPPEDPCTDLNISSWFSFRERSLDVNMVSGCEPGVWTQSPYLCMSSTTSCDSAAVDNHLKHVSSEHDPVRVYFCLILQKHHLQQTELNSVVVSVSHTVTLSVCIQHEAAIAKH